MHFTIPPPGGFLLPKNKGKEHVSMNKKVVYSVEELAAALGISRASAYQLVHDPNFPSIRVGKRILIPVAGLEQWLARGTQPGR